VAAADELIAAHHPAVFAKLKALGADTMIWAQSSVMTLFTMSMDWATLTPVWTAFLRTGWSAVLKVLLYIVACSQAAIMRTNEFEAAVLVLKNMCGPDAPLDIMARADALAFTQRDLDIVAKVYAAPAGDLE